MPFYLIVTQETLSPFSVIQKRTEMDGTEHLPTQFLLDNKRTFATLRYRLLFPSALALDRCFYFILFLIKQMHIKKSLKREFLINIHVKIPYPKTVFRPEYRNFHGFTKI